ncbi:MAG: DUF1822 family protein [Cyanobacteria bacterium J06592_8]
MKNLTVNNESIVTIPLTRLAHYQAQKFQNSHQNPAKAKQVYLNTLAVYAVNYWLESWGVETDLEASESWNLALQTLGDTAELIVPGKGSLECRPIMPGSASCFVPPEVWSDRIAYIAVELNSSLTEARLLGFFSSVSSEDVPLNQLKSLDNLLDDLMQLKPQALVKLGQWLQNKVDDGWQTIESFIEDSQVESPVRSRFAYRSLLAQQTVERIKLIGPEIEQRGQPIAMLIQVTPTLSSTVNISTEISLAQAVDSSQSLQVMLLNEEGEVVMEGQAVTTEEIKLEFSGEKGDSFSIRIIWDDICFTEKFTI